MGSNPVPHVTLIRAARQTTTDTPSSVPGIMCASGQNNHKLNPENKDGGALLLMIGVSEECGRACRAPVSSCHFLTSSCNVLAEPQPTTILQPLNATRTCGTRFVGEKLCVSEVLQEEDSFLSNRTYEAEKKDSSSQLEAVHPISVKTEILNMLIGAAESRAAYTAPSIEASKPSVSYAAFIVFLRCL